jgi:hypothetical protein
VLFDFGDASYEVEVLEPDGQGGWRNQVKRREITRLKSTQLRGVFENNNDALCCGKNGICGQNLKHLDSGQVSDWLLALLLFI